jgi:tRNA A-37 threonylcarbamoyl transferase component Bud32
VSATSPPDAFDSAVEEYLTLAEAGKPPEAEEFISYHPECAGELRQFLSDLQLVDAVVREAKATSDEAAAARPSSTEDADELGLPQMTGFRILGEIGSGSQGVVYKAEQHGTRRLVALKVIREGAFASKSERRRFQREIEFVSKLQHPNIVTVYACGQEAGHEYYAMEFVEGEALDTFLSGRTLSIEKTIGLFLQICDAISYAHQRGVIHRDLKPSNILIDSDGRPRIVDFGLAKPVAESAGLRSAATRVGDFAGTWYYASPEQVRRDSSLVDVRSEIYTLGVIFYEMLTDSYPYPIEEESSDSLARHILSTPPTRPRSVRRDLDDDIETIVLRCLSKEPQRRYQSVAGLHDDLLRYLHGEAIEAKRDSFFYVLGKALHRHRWRAAGVAAALAGLVVFTVVVAILYTRAERLRKDAVAARATLELQAHVDRDTRRYLINKLDDLHRARNRIADVVAMHPNSPVVERMLRPPCGDPRETYRDFLSAVPTELFSDLFDETSPGYTEAYRWVKYHGEELAEIAELGRTHRFVLNADWEAESEHIATRYPGSLLGAQLLCDSLLAAAIVSYSEEEYQTALGYLESARSAARDIGDGPLLDQKGRSLKAREHIYDVMLRVTGDQSVVSPLLERYIEWGLSDPPLPELRPALISRREILVQFLRGASERRDKQARGSVSLERLNEITGGTYQRLGLFNDEYRRVATAHSPFDFMGCIDDWISGIENWESLTCAQLEQRNTLLRDRLRQREEWKLIQPLVSAYLVSFKRKGRIEALRRASILACHLRRYRGLEGRWPVTLADAIPDDLKHLTTDPYVGLPYVYSISDEAPLLYSINEDGVDDQGNPGDWGVPGTDVVFFQPASRDQ